MYLLIVFLSLFVEVIAYPTQNDMQEILRHLPEIPGMATKTEIEQELQVNSLGLSDGILQAVLEQANISKENASSSCTCQSYNCGCCVFLKWKVVGLNDRVCTNFSHLPAPDYGISVTFSVDKKTIINVTVSARDPPPICAGIPELEKYASLCIKFKDLQVTDKTFSGCAFITARIIKIQVADIKLGCFKIPPGDEEATARVDDLQTILVPDLTDIGEPEYRNQPSDSSRLYFQQFRKQKIRS